MHLHTEDKNKHNFLVYKINNGSILEDKINNGDIILNIISTEEIDEKKNLSSIDLSLNHSSLYLTPEIILKRNLNKIVDSKSDVCIIVKRHTSHKLDFITLKHKEIIDQKKSFIQRKLSSNITSSLIDSERLIEYLEEKAYWSRYGL